MTSEVRSRTRLLALLMAAPAVLGLLALSAIEVYRWIRPESTLFVAPSPATLASAIQVGDVEGAFGFIRAGANPNRPLEFSDPQVTGGRVVQVSPLLLAAAVSERDSMVLMLLGFGARMDLPPDSLAACLADEVGNAPVAALLRDHGARPASACPAPVNPGQPPLLAYAASD